MIKSFPRLSLDFSIRLYLAIRSGLSCNLQEIASKRRDETVTSEKGLNFSTQGAFFSVRSHLDTSLRENLPKYGDSLEVISRDIFASLLCPVFIPANAGNVENMLVCFGLTMSC